MTKKEKQKTNIDKTIKKLLEEILSKLKIKSQVVVSKDKEQDHFQATINTEETGLLIGWHGETINSLQLILGVVLYRKLGSWTRVLLDVGGYRENRKVTIEEMVERIIDEVLQSNQPAVLPYLTPYERRIVHLMLGDNKEVVSESEGEGRERRVVIKPRES